MLVGTISTLGTRQEPTTLEPNRQSYPKESVLAHKVRVVVQAQPMNDRVSSSVETIIQLKNRIAKDS